MLNLEIPENIKGEIRLSQEESDRRIKRFYELLSTNIPFDGGPFTKVVFKYKHLAIIEKKDYGADTISNRRCK
jgi:hypothetical protein